jgi:hypothetical protein
MPIERRQITLSQTEVMQAIQSYRRTRADFLPHGEVTDFVLETAAGDGGVHLTINVGMVYGQTRQTISIETEDTDVVELLIRCCLENNIPIPKISRKSAGIIDGMLTLIICSTGDSLDAITPEPSRPSRTRSGGPATIV